MKVTKIYDRRPENGCARCWWWNQHRIDNWGKCCAQPGVVTWWQHGPCSEYELDDNVPDEIQLVAD